MTPLLLFALAAAPARAQFRFDPPFFFGVASAPGQSEDALDDVWADWGARGKVAGWAATPRAADRLAFWTRPEVELDAAARAGASVYRLGVDWGRVEPRRGEFDVAALARYRAILRLARARGLRPMVTLLHHSTPRWVQERGGWLDEKTKADWLEFAERAIDALHGEADSWVTFNEPNVFAPLAYAYGLWPPGERRSRLSVAALGPFRGEVVRAEDRMAEAHDALYVWAHAKYPSIRIGFAQNMALYTGRTWRDRLCARAVGALMNWRFPERARGAFDFFGINYYGAEWLKDGRLVLDPDEEYSEAGRAVKPEGLRLLLKEIARRFPGVPVIVTENGIADSTDVLRPAYLLEHLAAVARARDEGVPVAGYLYWTLSDNMEWADGYCPKFGLMSVDRARGLRRLPRASFALFRTVATRREVTPAMRAAAWAAVAAHAGTPRPFCRADDAATPLAEPVPRPFSRVDWRFR